MSMAQCNHLKTTTMQEKKKKHQPEGTTVYTVQESDTLERIAAHFDTTPSELKKLNKLISAMLYPGQTLFIPGVDYIPRKSTISSVSSNEESASSSEEKCRSPDFIFGSLLDKPKMDVPLVKAGNISPTKVPGHAERQTSVSSPKDMYDFELVPPHKLLEDEEEQLDKDCMKKFTKINVRYITDGLGVVKGTLLVTPNAVMFDPDVLDPLVIEHSAETYGMIAPMDMIISAAMYHDISAMKMRGQIMDDGTPYHMPEVYHDHTCLMAKERLHSSHQQDKFSSVLPKDIHKTLSNSRTRNDSVCLCGAVDNINTSAGEDNHREADDKGDKDGDSRVDDVSDECKKDGQDVVLNKVLCAMEEYKCDQDIIITDHGEDFNFSTTKADELNTTQTEANSDIGVSVHDNLNVDSHANVADADSNKMKYIIKQGRSERRLTVTFSISDLEEFQRATNTPANIESNEINSNINMCIKDDAKLIDFDNDILKEAPKMDHISEDSDKKTLEKTACLSTGTNTGIDFFLPKDPLSEHGIENTATMISEADIEEYVDISISELENSGSVHTVKTETKAADVVRTSSKSSLGPFNTTPHLNAFVNYASSIFKRHQSVKDINNVMMNPVTDFEPEESLLERKLDIPVIAVSSGKRHGKLSRHGNTVVAAAESDTNTNMVAVESAITMDEKPDLLTMDFKSNEPGCLAQEFAPKPAVIFHDPPLYLCLRLGRQSNEKHNYHNYPMESYGKRRKRSEYWFSIPREKVDHLYAFLVQWTPEIYGDDEDITPEKRGFVVIDDNYDEEVDSLFGLNSNFHKEWEIISQSEALRRHSIVFDAPIPLPELIGESSIMTEEHIAALSQVLLGRIVGYPWTLIYSTYTNGFSLNTLYRDMVGLDSPVLLVVIDDKDSVFGALTSRPLKVSESFYGTGESFLYTFYPEFKVFAWSGENNFFIKGNKESLSIGAGHGVFGLWFDEDLYHGRTNRCETYKNDILTHTEDFIVKGLEAWAFFWD